MKQKLLILSTTALIMGMSINAQGMGWFIDPMTLPIGGHMWIDPAMTAATALDAMVTKKFQKRTIDASDAISKLQKALAGGQGGGSCGGGGSAGDASQATVYTPDMVMTQIEMKQKPDQMFDKTRQAIQDYLFETTDSNIKGDCQMDDKTCATQRQNEWLLASVTLASATADKVLDLTAKKNAGGKSTSSGTTSLTAHFQTLASSFNAQTSPTGLYNSMADIVLDTHRQVNDANALQGRDLEASGLRVINETGPELLTNSDETEE